MFTLFKDWLYFLQDKDGRSYRVNNGNVEPTGTPTFLQEGPDGWQEKSIRWGRSQKYYGMVRSYSTPLKFVKQGAQIIRDALMKVGTEARLFLLIHKLDKTFGAGLVHKNFYKGELDLSTAQSSLHTVTVNLLEGGLDALLKANEGTTYEIPMDSPGAVILEHDGINIRSSSNFIGIDEGYITVPATAYNLIWPHMNLVNTEGVVVNAELQSTEILSQYYTSTLDDDGTKPDNWFIRATDAVTFRFQRKFRCELDFPVFFRVYLKNSNGTRTVLFEYTNPPLPDTVDVQIDFDIDEEVTLAAGESLQLIVTLTRNTLASGTTAVFIREDEAFINYNARFQVTRHNAFPPLVLGQLLLDKIAGPGYTLESDILSTDWKGLLITSGDALRGFTNAKLKSSWNNYWKSLNAVLNLEMRITGDRVVISPKGNAFGSQVVAALGAVTTDEEQGFKPAVDYMYNTIKVGYPDSDVEKLNGRDEVNVGQTYTTPLTRVVRELDITSDYLAAIYEIEYARINYDGKNSTNSEVDSKVFFIHCNNNPVLDESGLFFKYTIRRDTYDSITGVFDPASVYNIEISPKRNLLRHGNFIRGGLYFEQAGYVTFQGSDKNADLETVTDATIISPEIRIKESSDVHISTLDSPLFIPLEFTGESPSPAGISDIMENTPTERFSFIYRDLTYYGFPLEVQVQPADNAPQETRLLLSPNNNIQNLIHG